jgi:hypothetical protein
MERTIMEITELPVILNVIRIDGHKLTTSILEQFEISTLFDYIAINKLADFNFESYQVDAICRISSLPIIKRHRTHLLSLHGKEYVERLMRRFGCVKEFGLWSIDGEVLLNPIGGDSNFNSHQSWDKTLKKFDSLFLKVPKVVYGI